MSDKPEAFNLTSREREILRLVDQHLSSKQIARELGLSKTSVDTYCDRARRKLGVTDRYEAARHLRRSDVQPSLFDDALNPHEAEDPTLGGTYLPPSAPYVRQLIEAEQRAALSAQILAEYQPPPTPPGAAEKLIGWLCPADRVEAVLGDLEQSFNFVAQRYSPRAARRWYWWTALRSLFAFFGPGIGRLVAEASKRLGA